MGHGVAGTLGRGLAWAFGTETVEKNRGGEVPKPCTRKENSVSPFQGARVMLSMRRVVPKRTARARRAGAVRGAMASAG